MNLGACADGRLLTYDASLYEFHLAGKPVTLEHVRALDAHAKIRWRACEMRDWLRNIQADDFETCHERAWAQRNSVEYDSLSAEDRVLADAARDDSVLAGKIVEADPALVHAVANSLIEQGLLTEAMPVSGGVAGEGDEVNPLAVMELPRGMEPLSQLERAKGSKRKMTRSEQRLMRKILKNDDKEKERRERRAAAAPPPKEEAEPDKREDG